MKPYLIYSKDYDFSVRWLNKLHPFDGLKFSKAWALVSSEYGDKINALWLAPKVPVSDKALLKVHNQDYLNSLLNSKVIAKVVEIWIVSFIPNKLLQAGLIKPMKLACAGTILAAETALTERAIAMNFGGGFHHAFADHGEGFCFFADAALSIADIREKGLLTADDKVLMIDVDAHRGNGFESLMGKDLSVSNFDMYSFQTYPGLHHGEPDDYPYMIPLKLKMEDTFYLNILEMELVKFLDDNKDAKLAFYNAGNDILDADPLGGLNVSADGVIKRDRYVIEQLVKRNLPTVVMTSGGYTKQSHQLIAALAGTVIDSVDSA